jgi:hypothetical protein
MRDARAILAAASAVFLALAAPATATDQPDATLTFEQVQVAFIGSGSVGGGTLEFRGKEHPFSIGGVGVGGFGISKISATGEVFGLQRVEDFEGTYAQVRYGIAVGDLWLESADKVRIHLRSRREGLALSVGGDAVYIRLD